MLLIQNLWDNLNGSNRTDKMIEDNPDAMTEAQIEQGVKMMEMMFNPLIGSAFWIASKCSFWFNLVINWWISNEKQLLIRA